MYTAGSSLAAANDSVAFCPDGRVLVGDCARVSATGAGSMIFILCYDGKLAEGKRSRSRAILVNRAGQVRLAAHNDNGVPLNEGNSAVTSCTSPQYLW